MTHLRRFLVLALVMLCAVGIVLHFGGCSKVTPLEPEIRYEEAESSFPPEITKAMNVEGDVYGDITDEYDPDYWGDDEVDFPLYGSNTFQLLSSRWRWRGTFYQGGVVFVNNGTKFYVFPGAITPPPGQEGQPVTITIEVEQNEDGELIFTFGPSGTQFRPSGLLRLSWKGLKPDNDEVVKLFYIDSDDQYIEQKPRYIDVQGQCFYLFIDHFSRYAISKCR